jgi:hypothetical protein
MATQKLNLTRDQLATFLKNHEQIKQFERLFQVVDEVAPNTDTQGTAIVAENAQASANSALAQLVVLAIDAAINNGAAENKAQQALDALNRIANAVEMAALQPATQNNNSVVTDYIDLPEDGPHVTQARRVQWNQDDGTVDVGLYGGSVLQVGQETMFYSKNTSGALIPNGTPVMFTGTVGSSGKLTFGLAVADGSVPADYMMGVTTQDIADNGFGYVTSFGLVRGFNTTGTPYGEVWNDGDLLYFGAAAPGTWTKVQPIAPRIDVPVAVVVNAGGGGSGSIFVRMSVAESLARLQDVYISGLANGDLLQYDLAQQRWENVPASTLPVGTATNLAGGAAGSVPYQSAPSTTTFRVIGTAGQVFRVNAGATAPEWVSSSALTKVDDTNVTLTLGGSPASSLLAATSLTLGWTGQLSTSRGGTGLSAYTAGDLLYYASGTALSKLSIGAANTVLTSSGSAPQWSTSLALASSFSALGNVSVGTTLTGAGGLAVSTNQNISFAESGGAYATLFRQVNSASLCLNYGYQRSTNVNAWASSIATATTRSSIRLNGANIEFYTDASSTVAVGTDIAPTLRGYFNVNGQFLINTTTAIERLTVNGNASVGDGTDITPSASGVGQLRLAGNGYGGYIALDASGMHIGHNSSGRILTLDVDETERARVITSGYFKASPTASYANATAPWHEFNGVTSGYTTLYVRQTSTTGDGVLINVNSNSLSYYLLRGYSGSAGVDVGYWWSDGSWRIAAGKTYGSLSDIKLKDNVQDATPKLSKLMRLRVRNYSVKSEPGSRYIGWIAQEFEEVFPGLVGDSEDSELVKELRLDENGVETEVDVQKKTGTTTKYIKESALIPILVKSVQELKEELDALKGEIEILRSKQ